MNLRNRMGIFAVNILLFAALFGFITLNKKVLRGAFSNSDCLNIITGCFPNLIAAYILSLAFVSGVLFRKPNYARAIIYVSSAVVFVILTIEEIRPMWGASTHFDPMDIVASGIGSVLAVLTFELIVFSRKKYRSKSNHRGI